MLTPDQLAGLNDYMLGMRVIMFDRIARRPDATDDTKADLEQMLTEVKRRHADQSAAEASA